VRVTELWRYPVKSLQGERLDAVVVTAEGLDGDRRYAIFDLDTELGLTARRVPELLLASASLSADGRVRITLPDGRLANGDDVLSGWLGRRVALRAAEQNASRRYEDVIDFEREQSSGWRTFEGASGPFHDSQRARVSLVSTDTIGAWDPRRFRANILLDGTGEDALAGSTIALGEAILNISGTIQRCVMVTRPQPGGIDRDLGILRTIARERAAHLAVGAIVSHPGIVRVGDELNPA
jgi:MOSC domain-containing protein